MSKWSKVWPWMKKNHIPAVLITLFFGVVGGLIANELSTGFHALLVLVYEFIVSNLTSIFIIGTLIFIAFFLANIYINMGNLNMKLNILNANIGNKDQLFMIGDWLLKNLPRLISTRDLDEEMHELVKDLLEQIAVSTHGVYGGSLYLPDPKEKDYLTIWEAYQVPSDSIQRAKCYVGSDPNFKKRGVAGECFVNKEILVAHKTDQKDEEGNWKFDRESYKHFPRGGADPAFQSFICVPIKEPQTSHYVGVVSFDSTYPTTFDSLDVKETLERLAQFIASLLLLYQKLQDLQLLSKQHR